MKACAVNLWTCMPHHTDHLVPLCELLNIPLLVSDPQHAAWVQDHYPGVEVVYLPEEDQTPAYFLENYDILFRANIWDMRLIRKQLAPLEEAFEKRLHVVHIPHGMSDKTYWFERLHVEEVVLAFGENLRDMLRENGVESSLRGIMNVGNLRLDYYQRHKAFLDERVEQEIFQRFSKAQPTVLYAPTWTDTEEASSAFDALAPILEGLPDSYNLLVKLHPYLMTESWEQIEALLRPHLNKENVVLLDECPYVYPVLERCDIYVGDTSSVGYDFLAFSRPMFFLNQFDRDGQEDRRLFLTKCGTSIARDSYREFWEILAQNLPNDSVNFETVRSEVYAYTFDPSISVLDFKERIMTLFR